MVIEPRRIHVNSYKFVEAWKQFVIGLKIISINHQELVRSATTVCEGRPQQIDLLQFYEVTGRKKPLNILSHAQWDSPEVKKHH